MTTSWPAAFHKRSFRGFTLVELIVAMGITIIILTLLVSITGVALDGWRVSRNKVRAARQAKAALEQVSKDFESMVVRRGNNYENYFNRQIVPGAARHDCDHATSSFPDHRRVRVLASAGPSPGGAHRRPDSQRLRRITRLFRSADGRGSVPASRFRDGDLESIGRFA